MKKMKKAFAGFLAAAMMLSLSVTAFAAEDEEKPVDNTSTVTITKTYNATNTGTISPQETFNFSIVKGYETDGDKTIYFTDTASSVTADNMPLPGITSALTFSKEAAGSENKTQDITVTLPTYGSVGIYYYTIKETAGNTAGVTYDADEIVLKVTVTQEEDGTLLPHAVVVSGTDKLKTTDITNVYSAGTLDVKKVVTGNLGDQSKEFTVTVTFTAPSGKTVSGDISYIEDGTTKTISSTDWKNGTASAAIALKHGETITFTNIPYDVTYSVTETDYTSDGYDDAAYEYSDNTNKKIDSDKDTVTITNNKSGTIDTGITMDSLPYIVALALVLGFAVVMIARRRRIEG